MYHGRLSFSNRCRLPQRDSLLCAISGAEQVAEVVLCVPVFRQLFYHAPKQPFGFQPVRKNEIRIGQAAGLVMLICPTGTQLLGIVAEVVVNQRIVPALGGRFPVEGQYIDRFPVQAKTAVL